VTDLRYAPPAALVADVHDSRLTPQSVRRACQLFIASTLLGFVGLTEPFELPDLPRGGVIGAVAAGVVLISLMIGLLLKVYRGRNWARWTMLALLAPSWVFEALALPEQILQAPVEAAVGIAASALDILVCWLLFFGRGASGYFRQAGSTSSQAGEA